MHIEVSRVVSPVLNIFPNVEPINYLGNIYICIYGSSHDYEFMDPEKLL